MNERERASSGGRTGTPPDATREPELGSRFIWNGAVPYDWNARPRSDDDWTWVFDATDGVPADDDGASTDGQRRGGGRPADEDGVGPVPHASRADPRGDRSLVGGAVGVHADRPPIAPDSDAMTTGPSSPDTTPARASPSARSLGRRGFLAAVGATALGAGAVGTVAADEYGNVVNVLDEGADNSGDASITPVLYKIKRHYGSDTLVKFPEGRYYMDRQFRFTDFNNVGYVGNDATLVPASYADFQGPQYRLFRLGTESDPGRYLRFAGFTVDQTAKNTGTRVIETVLEHGLHVEDVTVKGYHDSGTWGPARFVIKRRKGWGRVKRFRAPYGGELSKNAPGSLDRGPTGIIVDQSHRGTLGLIACDVGGFPDNGLYARSSGTVRVVGGHYRNSDTASIRLAGYGCLVRHARVTVDGNPQNFDNQRGIRLDAGTGFHLEDVTVDLVHPNGHAITLMPDVGRTRIENVSISIGDRVNHGIVVHTGANATDIVDTDVKIAGGGNAVHIEEGSGKVVCERMIISGMASGATFRHAIRCNRDGSEFRGLEIWQPGPHKRRAIILNADDCLVYKTLAEVRQIPLLVTGTGAWIEGNDLSSYDDWPAIKLADSSADVTIKDNTLENGVINDGSARLEMYGNTIT